MGARGEREGVRRRVVFGRPLALALVVAEKAISTLLLAAGGTAALLIRRRAGVNPVAALLPGEWREDPRDSLIRWLAGHAPAITPHHITWIATGLFAWALLFAVEAVGLWQGLGWAELLIIVETASFLPFEIWHLAVRPDAAGLMGLAVNLLILLYVTRLYRKSRVGSG